MEKVENVDKLDKVEKRAPSFTLSRELLIQYRDFHLKEIPFETLVFLMIIITTSAVNSMLGLVYIPREQRNSVAMLSFSSGIPTAAIGWVFLTFKYIAKHASPSPNAPDWRTRALALQNVFVLVLSVFLGLRMWAKIRYGQCTDEGSLAEHFHCNPHASTSGFPVDSFLALALLPLLYPTILRDTDWAWVAMSWIVTNFFLLISSIKDGTVESWTVFIYYLLLSGLSMYANQKQNIRSFVVQQQLSEVIKQNEEMAQELRANELRHMIGNVAHDLKTPLASFVSGLDMIADIAQDGLSKISDQAGSARRAAPIAAHVLADMADCLQGVVSTAQNSRNINNFMMMTINRCIDYTKASKGLKLVPKYETVDLLETLSLPFKCMRDVSQRVKVHLEPINKSICTHIITDKQWLQENILCLLSNAVKYSAGGTVNGRVSLTSAEVVGPGHRGEKTFQESASTCSTLPVRTASSNSSSFSLFRGSRANSKVYADDHVVPDSPIRTIVVKQVDSAALVEKVLLVEVEDTGIGMTEDMMGSLFNAFRQAQRLAGGTGLGLFSLARRIEALGGAYGVRKRPDGIEGSVFWFTVPYRPDEQFAGLMKDQVLLFEDTSEVATYRPKALSEDTVVEVSDTVRNTNHIHRRPSMDAKSNPTAKAALTNSLKVQHAGLRVLIVDDSPAIQKMMSMMLRRHGHVVDQADNGAHAVALITNAYSDIIADDNRSQLDEEALKSELLSLTAAYDVVLMDLQMPVMDGLEAMRRIRKAEQRLLEKYTALDVKLPSMRVVDGDLSPLPSTLKKLTSIVSDAESEDSRRSLHLDRGVQRSGRSGLHQLIIGVSANSDTDTMQEALRAGADSFVGKPFSIDSFYSTVSKCFHQQKAVR